MTISDLYHRLHIPPNLQRHMLEVTAVGEYLCEYWTGEPINIQLVRDTLLLHDLGNIVKFTPPSLGQSDEDSVAFAKKYDADATIESVRQWQKTQQFFIQRYGSRATAATVTVLKEIGAQPEIAEILLDMSPDKTGIIAFAHLETRICSFADMSVTPQGIEGFEARMVDLATRYPTERVKEAIIQERANAVFVQEHTEVEIMLLPREQLELRLNTLAQTEFELEIPPFFESLPSL
jgi:hypothetical protein